MLYTSSHKFRSMLNNPRDLPTMDSLRRVGTGRIIIFKKQQQPVAFVYLILFECERKRLWRVNNLTASPWQPHLSSNLRSVCCVLCAFNTFLFNRQQYYMNIQPLMDRIVNIPSKKIIKAVAKDRQRTLTAGNRASGKGTCILCSFIPRKSISGCW